MLSGSLDDLSGVWHYRAGMSMVASAFITLWPNVCSPIPVMSEPALNVLEASDLGARLASRMLGHDDGVMVELLAMV